MHWQRLRLADGAPMCIEDAYLADSIIPNFLDQPLPESLYADLQRRDLMPTWGEDSVDAAVARPEEAELLGITVERTGAPHRPARSPGASRSRSRARPSAPTATRCGCRSRPNTPVTPQR